MTLPSFPFLHMDPSTSISYRLDPDSTRRRGHQGATPGPMALTERAADACANTQRGKRKLTMQTRKVPARMPAHTHALPAFVTIAPCMPPVPPGRLAQSERTEPLPQCRHGKGTSPFVAGKKHAAGEIAASILATTSVLGIAPSKNLHPAAMAVAL